MKQKKTKRDWDALMERIKEELPMEKFAFGFLLCRQCRLQCRCSFCFRR